MDFTFSEDQLLFRDSVRDFLSNEVTPDSIRERWETKSGRSREFWGSLADLGLTGMLVPESFDGLGMNEMDFVMLAEECGRVALPEPLVDTALLATPLLSSTDGNDQLLASIAAGQTVVAVQQEQGGLVADAEFANELILKKSDSVYVLKSDKAMLVAQQSVDPSRKLFSVQWQEGEARLLCSGEEGRRQQQMLAYRGALSAAAQLLGLAQRITEMSVAYTSERNQFGKPIGSFQAVKHHLANVAVKTEFARAPVYRAAYSVANELPDVGQHVSQAKLAASEAALAAAKSGIQVHGAMGYTWEVDLHIFMKRAWVLDGIWGTRGEHKACLGEAVFSAGRSLGAGHTFASALHV